MIVNKCNLQILRQHHNITHLKVTKNVIKRSHAKYLNGEITAWDTRLSRIRTAENFIVKWMAAGRCEITNKNAAFRPLRMVRSAIRYRPSIILRSIIDGRWTIKALWKTFFGTQIVENLRYTCFLCLYPIKKVINQFYVPYHRIEEGRGRGRHLFSVLRLKIWDVEQNVRLSLLRSLKYY